MKNDDLREFLKNNLRIRIKDNVIQYGNGSHRIEVELFLRNEFTGEEISIDDDSIEIDLPN